jgi:hypothetical protein
MASVLLGVLAVAAPVSAAYADTEQEAHEALLAIQSAAPSVLQDVSSNLITAEGDFAASISNAHSSVDIPTNPAEGIVLGGGDSTETTNDITVGLPFSEHAASAEVIASGIVSYDNENGSLTVPILKSDGSLQITTIINGADAPQRYEYPLALPAGGSIQLSDIGSVAIFNADRGVIGMIEPAWAKDANGSPIATHYELEGTTLVQVVDLSDPTIAYPVVADPKFAMYGGVFPSIQLSRSETKQASTATGLAPICGQMTKFLGYAAGILCGVSALQIIAASALNYSRGDCSQLVPAPGLILAFTYRGGYCK